MNVVRLLIVIIMLPVSLSAVAAEWLYRERTDEMTDEKIKIATLISSNTDELSWPYSGGTRGQITLRGNSKGPADVIFAISSGQLICAIIDHCVIDIRFDNEPSEEWAVEVPADYSADAFFIVSVDRFYKKLTIAKKILIRVDLYNNGQGVFQFSPHGLAWK